jgi:hypothetical protein
MSQWRFSAMSSGEETRMHLNGLAIAASMVLTVGGVAQNGLPKPEVSKDPLTNDFR